MSGVLVAAVVIAAFVLFGMVLPAAQAGKKAREDWADKIQADREAYAREQERERRKQGIRLNIEHPAVPGYSQDMGDLAQGYAVDRDNEDRVDRWQQYQLSTKERLDKYTLPQKARGNIGGGRRN